MITCLKQQQLQGLARSINETRVHNATSSMRTSFIPPRGFGPGLISPARFSGPALITPSTITMAQNKKKPPPQKGPEQPPPRITTNVKHNLKILKLWREFRNRKSNTPRPTTSYRRKKKAVQEEYILEDTELYDDPTTTLFDTNQGLGTAVPVLLVDGYNVCGHWAKLKKHIVKGRLDNARQKLVDELITFSALKKVRVVVVFDAMMSGLPTHKESFAGIDLVFSGNSSADSWIEHEVAVLKKDGCPKVWVATNDICQQHAAHGAGAFIWSCNALVREMKASQMEYEQILKDHRSTSMQGKLLRHNISPEVVDALKDLQKRLLEN